MPGRAVLRLQPGSVWMQELTLFAHVGFVKRWQEPSRAAERLQLCNSSRASLPPHMDPFKLKRHRDDLQACYGDSTRSWHPSPLEVHTRHATV